MIIRSVEPRDVEEINRIHERYFMDQFEQHDFLHNHHCAFVVSDDRGIIAVSGIRPIAEIVAVTNKDRSVKDRMTALYMHLEANSYVAGKHGYSQIYVFTKDNQWHKRLKKSFGFVPAKGEVLVLDL